MMIRSLVVMAIEQRVEFQYPWLFIEASDPPEVITATLEEILEEGEGYV